MSFVYLRDLAYLTAVINEGLRLSFAVSGRLPRIDRRKSHVYSDYLLPAGTVISTSLRPMHVDRTVYPSPYLFDPDRWLEGSSPEQKKLMDRNFVPFGRGSRSCIGRDLAIMTLYLMTASFFSQFKEVRLWETEKRDLAMEFDLFAPFPRVGSRGLKVVFE